MFSSGQALAVAPVRTKRQHGKSVVIWVNESLKPFPVLIHMVAICNLRLFYCPSAEWKAGAFGLIPGDDKEFIPLPETH